MVLMLRTSVSEGDASVMDVIILYWVLFGSANQFFPVCDVQNIYLHRFVVYRIHNIFVNTQTGVNVLTSIWYNRGTNWESSQILHGGFIPPAFQISNFLGGLDNSYMYYALTLCQAWWDQCIPVRSSC